MNKKDNGIYHNFRLSRSDPEQMHINKVLTDLNKNKYKSKNQFIAEALSFYIRALEGEELTNFDKVKDNKPEYVTTEDLEQFRNEILEEVHRQNAAFWGGCFREQMKQPPVMSMEHQKEEQQINDTLLDLAASWGD